MQEILRQHIEKIVPLTDDEFTFIAAHFSIRHAARGEFLFQQGERVKYSYFVVSGLLKLVYDDDSSKQHIASFAMEDWWESDYLAFYTQRNATMSLQCIEATDLFCLTLEDYRQLCAGLRKMEQFFLHKSNYGNIGAQQRILSFLTSNAKERYEQLLHRYPSLLQRVPKTQLAAYLGVSRETLSRLGRS
ncbi:Crp/Fnr family transcriptional regulator [Chitinophaga solisilvae]|uniref:Crp/Fnr family transcriptional regulator n=1 Tax=Chitinophaga solisilvae TaxID=1233460 RepID=UPI00136F4BEB|nr:Crp/Fnr family transcriptional regulator [Chitinophaga solisilvae]